MPDLSGGADLARPRVVVSSAQAAEAAARAPAAMRAARQQPPGRPAAVQTDQFGRRAVTVVVEDEPEYLTPELREQAARLSALRRQVRERSERLANIGGGAGGGLSYAALLDLRLRVLLDTLFPRDTQRGQRARLDFETTYEQKVMAGLDQLEVAIYENQIASGMELSPETAEFLAQRAGIAVPAAEQARRSAQEE
jgi:hypothetical protein